LSTSNFVKKALKVLPYPNSILNILAVIRVERKQVLS
jgi:hypothetical protein